MFSLLYDFGLFLFALIALPKLLWQWCFQGKYKESLPARLGFSYPAFSPEKGKKVIWIHSVSMGETRAIIPLFRKIRLENPNAHIVISTTTETGNAEAKRSMPEADAHFYLPLDFSWIIRRLFDRVQPTMLILCESDFWFHLLQTAKIRGIPVALVNGKVSERSCARFRKVPFFTRRLFSAFKQMCVQNALYRDRFLSMGIPSEKIVVTGNLKFDAPTKKMTPAEAQAFRDSLGISDGQPVLVIGSTHAPEEEWLLTALEPVWNRFPNLKVLLAPRHPERFPEVAHLFKERALAFGRLSETKNRSERLLLIDGMGILHQCYQIGTLAIVGGSFVSHVGGHNILEPVLAGTPVLFGPHLHNQPDFKELVVSAGAGEEVTVKQLPDALATYLADPARQISYKKACETLTATIQGATLRTYEKIFSLLKG